MLRSVWGCCLVLSVTSTIQAVEPIVIDVDLREAPRLIMKATLTIPCKPGPLALNYPKWIQGEHQPSGPISDLSGVKILAGEKSLTWTRDDVDLSKFHLTVPDGVTSLSVSLEYLVPHDRGGFGSGPATTPKLAILSWYLVMLYPLEAGQHVRDIPVRASVTLPTGWDGGTALPIASRKEGRINYEPTTLETLIDSPLLCGEHFREIPIGPQDGPKHFLTLVGDSAASIAIDPKLTAGAGRLVEETQLLFEARPYRSYRFLTTLSDHIGFNGIEHHESSDNRMPEKGVTDESYQKTGIGELWSHEFVHSWNGKYRRPATMCTPDYQKPLKTNLLWVYEGLTQYYGFVLAGRSGICSTELCRDILASKASFISNQKGRAWRSLEDTAVAAPHLYNSRTEWGSRRRSVDFYDEGLLIWLDTDTLIREKTDGRKSLDDFCKLFHSGQNGSPRVAPYAFEDVVSALNSVVAHDWKNFLERRVRLAGTTAPLDGLERGGWRMIWADEPTDYQKAVESENKIVNLTDSIGLSLTADGKVQDVIPGSAADTAGLGPSMKIIAVNGRRWDADRLRDAVKATKDGKEKLEFIIENVEFMKTISVPYTGGAKYPHLERMTSEPDRLSDILKPKSATQTPRKSEPSKPRE